MRLRIVPIAILFGIAALKASAGEVIPVPSDARATYTVISLSKLDKRGMLTIIVERVGPSGTSYTKRLIDCRSMTFRYTGDGDTLDEVKRQNLSGRMSDLVEGSISYYVVQYACAKARH